MWWNKDKKEERDDLKATIKTLKNEKKDLEEEVARLKLKKKMEDEDIKHLVKINQERKEIELEKEKTRLLGAKDKEVMKVKDDYRDKIEKNLGEQVVQMKEMYGQILERLPDVRVRLKGGVE